MGIEVVKVRAGLSEGQMRTSKANKSIFVSFILKAADVAIDLIVVPVSLNLLTKTEYGIWLVISSSVTWLNLLDIGLGHGYRNKLSVVLAKNDLELARTYTSTVYAFVGLVSMGIAALVLVVAPLINWAGLLNAPETESNTLILVMLFVLGSFALTLTLRLITSVLLADQAPYWSNVAVTGGKLLVLATILLLLYYNEGDLTKYAAVNSIAPIVVLLLLSYFFFTGKYQAISPSLKYFKKSHVSEIMGLGSRFFIIQLGFTVLFFTDSIIISHIMGPSEVVNYQIVNKYFSIPLRAFSIIVVPFWSAVTEAYLKSDTSWIKGRVRVLNGIWLAVALATSGLLAFHETLISVWMSAKIVADPALVIQAFLFVLLQSYNLIYTNIINGIGKVQLQMLTSMVTLIINIPLSIFFARDLGMGSAGVLLATNISVIIYIITRKVQFRKIINNEARGIWNK